MVAAEGLKTNKERLFFLQVTHKSSVCPHRTITCRFCGDMVQAGSEAEDPRDRLRGLTQHESNCGSRTIECTSCGRSVLLKDMDLHAAAAHSADGAEASKFSVQPQGAWQQPPRIAAPSSSTNAAPSVQGQHLGHPAIECPLCGETYRGTDAEVKLNVHLDSEHFLTDSRNGMDVDGVGTSGLGGVETPPTHTPRRSLSVSCPICGLAVHSERDLSSHIDMVH